MQLAKVFKRQRLRQAGHAFQQHVAVGEQGDQQPVEQMLLADDDAAHLLLQRPDPGRVFHDRLARGPHAGVQFNRHGTPLLIPLIHSPGSFTG